MTEEIKQNLFEQLLKSERDKNTVKDLCEAIEKVTDFHNNKGRVPSFITINGQILNVCN